MSDRFARPDAPPAQTGQREKCLRCRGTGWMLRDDNRARRCDCNPGEMPRSWNGGEFGEPQYPKTHLESVRDPSEVNR